MSFTDRYARGECSTVCTELLQLGDSIQGLDQRNQAVAVARDFVDRSVRNLRKIHERLIGLKYSFDQEERSLIVRSRRNYALVDAFESDFGKIPIILREWHARVEALNFGQSEKQYLDFESELGGLGWHFELQMISLADARLTWEQHVIDSKEDREHFRKQGLDLAYDDSPILFTGGCASNNDSDGITLPCTAFDAVKRDDEDPQTVNSFFRTAFRHAGFPALEVYDSRLKESLGNILPRPNIERILPLLTEGLELV